MNALHFSNNFVNEKNENDAASFIENIHRTTEVCMGQITQEISNYIESLSKQGLKVLFCHGFNKPKPQTGQVCKLVAGAAVEHYLVNIKAHSQAALPVNKEKMFSESLRQRAKKVTGSQVGEVYGPFQMEQIFSYNQFEVTSYCITDRDIYAQFLIAALSQSQPVLVYFDVALPIGNQEDEQGSPMIHNGTLEHCAAIVGCYHDTNKNLFLIAAQWGEFYNISFDKLFDSTSQLSQLKQPETYQKYYPIPGFFHHKKWLNKSQMELALDSLCDNEQGFLRSTLSCINNLWPKDQKRISTPPNDISGSLANILTVISGDLRTVEFGEFDEFRLFSEIKMESVEEFHAYRL